MKTKALLAALGLLLLSSCALGPKGSRYYGTETQQNVGGARYTVYRAPLAATNYTVEETETGTRFVFSYDK